MQSKKEETRQRSTAFYLLYVPSAVIVAIVVGWSIFWYVASHQTAAAVTNWMTQEAKAGRIWTCPDQKTRGFPFAVEVSCANLRFQGILLDKTSTGTVRGFHVTAPLLRNDNLIARIESPFTAQTNDGTYDLTLQWSELYVELDGPPGTFDRVAIAGTDVSLQGRVGGAGSLEGKFGEIHSSFMPTQDRHDNSYDFVVSFNDGSIPALNTLLDSQLPIFMQLGGTISQAAFGGVQTLPEFFEKWRSADGHIDITSGRLTSGGVLVEVKGGLGLDDEHRVHGNLDAGFAGFQKAFRQLGIDPGLITAGQFLSGLLSKGGDVPGRLNLPVSVSEGFLSVGPVRTSIQIPPLY
ncbi:DUF2125 domain-containing protein [Methylocapsa sp. D3K7]|uniref:DUF2125 domain-containing protein n=1 Tax=Methylocapsa sp. D3K7 TaxID=3041435 RepID=UPI00244EB30C|nr:DUF2125 domain-containing protein [Methylocapsa sp. D3K7]WGJ15853.1 DUF2125 domain-containing protein [Methylocapsa sp. D3K7]